MESDTPAFDEMHCESCGSIVKKRAYLCMSCGVRISISEQPLTPLSSSDPPSTVTPSSWSLRSHSLPRPKVLLAVLFALFGGLLGIPAAFQAELPGGFLVPWLWAPVIEEVLKPAGVYLLLFRWPGVLKSQTYTAVLASLAGVGFALIESTIYVTVYVSDHSKSYLLFRFTVPVMIHALTSFIYGLGINQRLVESLTSGRTFTARNWGFFAAAIAIHSTYNISVTVWSVVRTINPA